MQYLKCQEKINPAKTPQFFFIFLFLEKKKTTSNMKRHHMQRQDQNCMRSMMPLQKNSRSTCFFCLPQKVPAQFSQET
jgi:hypothetical protein